MSIEARIYDMLMNKKFKFSLIELLIVFAILASLISLLQPSMQGMLANAERIQCMNNQRNLVAAFSVYQSDHEVFPHSDTGKNRDYTGWVGAWNEPKHLREGSLWNYILSEETYLCPADNSTFEHIRSYSITTIINNYYSMFYRNRTTDFGIPFFLKPTDSPDPSKTMVFLEENDWRQFNIGSFSPGGWGGWTDRVAGWHSLGMNHANMDGHVEYVAWQDSFTPDRRTEGGDFRANPDKIYILDAYSGGLIKP